VSVSEFNQEEKHLREGQGALGTEGTPTSRREERRPPSGVPARTGFHPRQYLDEVVLELRKVMKPKRAELVNYATVVFFTLAFLMALTYGLDYLYSLGATSLFK
jgi:preprotein translocase SecE subunit